MRKLCSLIFLFTLLALATTASATSISQPFNESGVGPFNDIQAFIFSPGTSIGMSSFSNGSWTNTNHNPNWSEASGTTLSSLNFNLDFGYSALPVTIDFYAFLDGVLKDSAYATYNGGWQIIDPMADGQGQYIHDVAASQPTSTPEPASWLLLGSGLLGFVGFAKRRIFA